MSKRTIRIALETRIAAMCEKNLERCYLTKDGGWGGSYVLRFPELVPYSFLRFRTLSEVSEWLDDFERMSADNAREEIG